MDWFPMVIGVCILVFIAGYLIFCKSPDNNDYTKEQQYYQDFD